MGDRRWRSRACAGLRRASTRSTRYRHSRPTRGTLTSLTPQVTQSHIKAFPMLLWVAHLCLNEKSQRTTTSIGPSGHKYHEAAAGHHCRGCG